MYKTISQMRGFLGPNGKYENICQSQYKLDN